MATNKKPAKKYKPKPVYSPAIVNQTNSFNVFLDALNKLLDTGEVEADVTGHLIYKDGLGGSLSFSINLRIYTDVIHIYTARKGIKVNTYPLAVLQSRMVEARGFAESEIAAAKKTIAECRPIFAAIPTIEFREILNTIRVSFAMNSKVTGSLKESDILLAKYKHRIGDLTYEDVLAREMEYQKLALEAPWDKSVIKLRDMYSEFLSAYKFARIKENNLTREAVLVASKKQLDEVAKRRRERQDRINTLEQ